MSLLLASCVLTACGGASGGSGEDGELDPDATVRFAITNPPTQLDPIMSVNEVQDISYFSPLYDRLTTVSEGKVVPQLAESWETSEDGLTWTFDLREGPTFHDGSPVDAEAVVANLQRAFDAREASGILAVKLRDVAGFKASDASTVVVELEAPRPGLAAAFAGVTMGIASPAAFDKLATDPVGSGPFTFVEQGADRVVYARNADYWDEERARAAGLEVLGIPDGTARLNAVRSGQVHGTLAQLDLAAQFKEMESDPAFTVVRADTQSVLTIYLNSQKPPLDDVRVRRALNYSVDRASLNEHLLGGLCTPTTQPFPSGAGHVDDLDDAFTYDPEKAADLLAEAGVKDLELDTLFLSAALSKAVSPALQDQMKQAGVTLNLKSTNPPDVRPLFREGNGDAMVHQINGELDSSLTLENNFLGPDNPGGLSPELSALAERAIQAPFDSAERTAALEEYSSAIVESPEHIHVCGIPDHFIGPDNVVGLDKMPWLGVTGYTDPSGLGLTN